MNANYKTVCKPNLCNGCEACVEICGKNAIHIEDYLSKLNAVINSEMCVGCGRCFSVCPNNHAPLFRMPIAWYEGWSSSDKTRCMSSSGGAAAALSVAFVRQGGVVCSCAPQDMTFGFSFAHTEEEVNKFAGSKYVKSNPFGVYDEIKKYIIQKKPVLFIGLPCQVAAVQNYVGQSDYLYTADLICHGTPSAKLLEMYLTERGYHIADLQKLKFRANTHFYLSYDGHAIEPLGVYGRYTTAFLRGVDYTENCYSCSFAQTKRVSDLTLGDSWGSEMPLDERNKGISLILCQTERGEKLLSFSDLYVIPADKEKAVSSNKQLLHPTAKSSKTEKFFFELEKHKHFNRAIMRTAPKTFIRQNIKTILLKLKALFVK